MLKADGVYTGYHNPGMNDGLHRISVRAFGLKASQASSSFSYALPISQGIISFFLSSVWCLTMVSRPAECGSISTTVLRRVR